MRRTVAALALGALPWLSGCDSDDAPAPLASPTVAATATSPPLTPRTVPATATAPLPTATAPPATATATAALPSATPSEARSPTVTSTPEPPTATRTITPTRTITLTPSLTPTLATGANISFFGVLRADNMVLEPVGFDDGGRAIFQRPVGSGFTLVVEARRGANNAHVGTLTFDHDPSDPSFRPDIQIVSSRSLGDGSVAVCDDRLPAFGGVPAVDPPDLDDSQATADALNDFGCRFVNGAGDYAGRGVNESCILGIDGEYRFAVSTSVVQFCAPIPAPLSFPFGDTLLTARVRDRNGVLGPPRQIVLRVGP